MLALRVLERIHGHLGWLAVAAMLHPAILLANPRRRARLAVALSAAVVVVTAGLGASIYPDYRVQLKPSIFATAPSLGWLFERKEHLAVGAVAFTLLGCVAHLAVPVFEASLRPQVARLAHRAFVVAFVLAAAVAIFGTAVASYKSF
jgi:hypothetical protein